MKEKRLRRRWARVSIVLAISGTGCTLFGWLMGRAVVPVEMARSPGHPGNCPAGCGGDREIYFLALPSLRQRNSVSYLESWKAPLLRELR